MLPASKAGVHAVIRGFLGNIHVVRMRFLQTGVRDADESGSLLQLADILGAAVAHTAAQAAHKLIHRFGKQALIRHASLDALGHELFVVGLEIAVLRAALHRGDGAHAAIGLELAPLIDFQFAGRLFAAGNQRADHNHIRAGGQPLHEIAGEFDAAVTDYGNALLLRDACRVEDGGHLRHADAGDDASRANGAGADANLDAVRARIDERFGRLRRSDIAGDELRVGERVLHGAAGVEDVMGMAVRRVEHQRIHADLQQTLGALQHVVRDADGGGAEQPSLRVLGGVRIFDGLFDVLNGD